MTQVSYWSHNLRIGLYGGPGCGKTTLAHWLVSELKKHNLNVEYVPEYIKKWAYQGRLPKGWDQKKVFDRQMEAELGWLTAGVEHIVTDSPILLQIAYMQRDGLKYHEPCLALAKMYEEEFPSHDIFLSRDGLSYESIGRYESLDQAKSMDEIVGSVLFEHAHKPLSFRTVDRDLILESVLERLGLANRK